MVQSWLQDAEVQLAKRLEAFYALHNPCNMSKAAELAKQQIRDVDSLNQALLSKYGYDLTTLPVQVWQTLPPRSYRPVIALLRFFQPTLP